MADFVEAARLDEIPVGGGKAVEIAGKHIALFNVGGQIYANRFSPSTVFSQIRRVRDRRFRHHPHAILAGRAMRGARPQNAADHGPGEPRWPALIAVIAATGLSVALAPGLTVGPLWLFPAIIGVLLVPTVIYHRTGHHEADRVLGFIVTSVVTIELIVSVIRLVSALPSRRESPSALLLSAGSIWMSNILVFALWYWRLDAGGPHGRGARDGHVADAFLFPQVLMSPQAKAAADQEGWSPDFLDYLFLAFNTSTAFSPTDTPVVARWGKALMMLQSLISLTVLALLAARAVNIL